MQRIILHIDFDSYFASCEQQFRPELRRKPVGVTATNGRTCIIAASREAKKAGVKSPSNVYVAKRICPNLLLVPADFTKYWEVSKKFISICKDYSPYVEVFSLDELFMDITQTQHLFGGTEKVITRIKKRIEQEIGPYITVSVGISHNKLLAKLASGLRKPNGVVFIGSPDLESIYKEAELTDICGIGERIKVRLIMMGITTLLHLKRTPLPSLIAEFGTVEGIFLHNVGQGIDHSRVVPYTEEQPVKSISRNYCLPENQYDMRVIFQEAYELCEEIGLKLRRLKMKARYVGMYLGGSISVGVGKTYGTYINTGQEIFDLNYRLIKQKHSGYYAQPEELRYVRRMSVYATDLRSESAVPESLFMEDRKKQTIVKIIDSINDKFGDHTIRNGFLLYAKKLTTVPNGYGPDTLERSKLTNFGL
ncbi:DNA polymerase IV [soil metagenome]